MPDFIVLNNNPGENILDINGLARPDAPDISGNNKAPKSVPGGISVMPEPVGGPLSTDDVELHKLAIMLLRFYVTQVKGINQKYGIKVF